MSLKGQMLVKSRLKKGQMINISVLIGTQLSVLAPGIVSFLCVMIDFVGGRFFPRSDKVEITKSEIPLSFPSH